MNQPQGPAAEPKDARTTTILAGDDRGRAAEFNRLTRLYAALSHVNQAIVRRESRDELLASVCQILVEQGGFRMAWIGWHDPESQRLMPVAAFGDDDQYLSSVRIYGDDRPEGRGPTGTAFREDRPYICNDLYADPATLPWRAEAERRGFHSSAVLPIREGGRPRGALSVYASEAGIFQDREMATLGQVADDVSFGLDHLASEAARREAERALAATTALLERTEAMAKVGGWELDLRTNALTWSREMYRIREMDPGIPVDDAMMFSGWTTDALPSIRAAFQACRDHGTAFDFVESITTARGQRRWVRTQCNAVREDGVPVKLVGAFQDITDRVEADLATSRTLERLTEAQRIGQIGDWEFDLASDAISWSPQTFEIVGRDPSLGPPRGYDEHATIYEPASAALVAEKVAAAIATGEAQDYELVALRPGGERVYIQAMAVPRKDGTGKVVALSGTVQDITERKRAEAAVHESEERLRLAVEAAELGTWDLDLTTDIAVRSLREYEIWGYQEVQPEWGLEIALRHVPPEDHSIVLSALAGAAATGGYAVEIRVLWPDGSIHWIDSRGRVIYDSDGIPARMVGVSADITERKQAEAERARLLHVLEASLNEIYIFDAQTLRFQYANDCARRNLGYSLEAMSALTAVDLKPEFSEATFNEAIGPLRSHEKEKLIFQTIHRRADGSIYPVEVHLQLVERDGQAVFLAVINDITERKRAESALRESEGKLRKVIDGLGPHMFVGLMTPDGVLIEANRPALEAAGLRVEDVLGKPFAETYWWAHSDTVQAQLVAAIARAAAGEPSRYDVQVRVAEAKLIWLDFSLFPVHDADGKVIFLVPSASVIDERKKLEADLRELAYRHLYAEDEERRRIAKELHDSTAQDLAAVLLNFGTLHDSLPALGAGPAQIIEDSIALLDNAANDIRTLSFALHPMRFDEVGLPGGLVEFAAGLGKRTGLRIGVEVEANFGRLREDSEHALFRVAQESLSNVVRHSSSDTATIRLTRPDANIVLEIEDQGRGLPPDLAATPGAFGVGIAGMRERLEHLGGRLEIVSSDGGTTVRAVLPAERRET